MRLYETHRGVVIALLVAVLVLGVVAAAALLSRDWLGVRWRCIEASREAEECLELVMEHAPYEYEHGGPDGSSIPSMADALGRTHDMVPGHRCCTRENGRCSGWDELEFTGGYESQPLAIGMLDGASSMAVGALGKYFAPDGRFFNQYQVIATKDGFTARAHGDLDCDGKLSTFERVVTVNHEKLELNPPGPLKVRDRCE